MYIIKNAWKSISRNKARNLLIGIIVLVIALSSCVALSIRQAAQTAKEDTLENLSVTAQISYDRSSAMREMTQQGVPGEEFDRSKMDFSALKGEELSLDDYIKYAGALKDDDSYYYSLSASLNASGELSAYSNSSADTSENDSEKSTAAPSMPSFGKGKNSFAAQGDFQITGFSSYASMMSLFKEGGSCTVTDGAMFDEETADALCVISDELAMYNNLAVGDTISLSNPNYEEEVYPVKICGIYTNNSSDSGNSRFSRSDPANNIYMSYNSLKAVIDASQAAGNKMTDSNDTETSAALTSEVNFTYVFASSDNYYSFETAVKDLGLSDNYVVSSNDISSFESSMTPLETLSRMAGWFFVVVLVVGGVILVVLNILSLRERKYEVGVLTAIGMKKSRVAFQFVCEIFTVTLAAIIIGTAAGAATSVPVTNMLLENQVQSAKSSQQNTAKNFGFEPGNSQMPESFNMGGSDKATSDRGKGMFSAPVSNYISSVSSATNLTVILELIGVGVFLTIISGMAAMISIMRYEPLKILSSRS